MDDSSGGDVCVFGVQRSDNARVQPDITGFDGNQLGNLHRLQVSRAKASWELGRFGAVPRAPNRQTATAKPYQRPSVIGTSVIGTSVIGTSVIGTSVIGTSVIGTSVIGTGSPRTEDPRGPARFYCFSRTTVSSAISPFGSA